jgi:glucose-6-phosphate-specific signal transduction histidine kinase
LTLARRGNRIASIVGDQRRGLSPDSAIGTGMRGMRERFTLIGARLEIGKRVASTGCEVRLELLQEDRA